MLHQYENPTVQQAHDRVFKQGRSMPKEPVLPPSFSEHQFHDLIKELEVIVGSDNVHTGEALIHFSDPFSPNNSNLPSAAVWYVTEQKH
jgi:hypothetical protein